LFILEINQSQTKPRKSQVCNAKPLRQTGNQTQYHNFLDPHACLYQACLYQAQQVTKHNARLFSFIFYLRFCIFNFLVIFYLIGHIGHFNLHKL